VPKHSGTLWGTYAFQKGSSLNGLSLGLGVIGVGKRPSDDFATQDLPGYVRTDAAVQYRLSKNLDVALNFKNLFNKKYFETSTFGTWENGISPTGLNPRFIKSTKSGYKTTSRSRAKC
jgi:iron complex outermembrane recepter protein